MKLLPERQLISIRERSFTDNKLAGFLQQGDISHDGIYQYLIKNQIDLSDKKDRIFSLSFERLLRSKRKTENIVGDNKEIKII